MNYKIILVFLTSFFLYSCENSSTKKINIKFENNYINKGFALIYDDNLKHIKKLDDRSLSIYHKSLKKKSVVKITNPENGNFLIANVLSNKIEFSDFYNSVLSLRIVETLDLDISEPYVEIILVSNNSTFIAKKAKTFEEERVVAEKAPIDGIQINDLNVKKNIKKKVKNNNFSYSIKVADFYYKDSALLMQKRIEKETSINNLRILQLTETKYRVLIGPFNDIKTLKEYFEKMSIFEFENLEILKNV